MKTKSADQTNPENCKCQYCGANMLIHGHRISKGLATTLIKFRRAVIQKGENSIHIKDEISLTKSEYNNFQKLRYHGLVAKTIDPDSKQHISGYWLLTKRGNQFCKNEIEIPQVVYTFRNRIHSKSPDYTRIDGISKLELPYFDEKDDFLILSSFIDTEDVKTVEYDAKGQTILNF